MQSATINRNTSTSLKSEIFPDMNFIYIFPYKNKKGALMLPVFAVYRYFISAPDILKNRGGFFTPEPYNKSLLTSTGSISIKLISLSSLWFLWFRTEKFMAVLLRPSVISWS